MMEHLAQILMLLAVAVAVVVTFQQLHIPSNIGYLLVDEILGPHTIGPTFNVPKFRTLAEFGVVFLLLTIGLNYLLPQLHTLRYQVESTIRPFRDVLLGLFFVGTGMLIDPAAIPGIWHWTLLGVMLILTSKSLLVTAMVRMSGITTLTAWRAGLMLAVGATWVNCRENAKGTEQRYRSNGAVGERQGLVAAARRGSRRVAALC